jgi:hypothetical protein
MYTLVEGGEEYARYVPFVTSTAAGRSIGITDIVGNLCAMGFDTPQNANRIPKIFWVNR